jgi:hypothetical protein
MIDAIHPKIERIRIDLMQGHENINDTRNEFEKLVREMIKVR